MSKKVYLVCLIFMILSTNFCFQKTAKASTSVSKWVLEGTIHKKMPYQNPKVVRYPNSNYGSYSSTLPASYFYGKGYLGTLHATEIKLVPTEKRAHWITNRYTTIVKRWNSDWEEYANNVNEPSKFYGTYYDSKTDKNIKYSLSKWDNLFTTDTRKTWIYYISHGRALFYDKKHHFTLGFMANNPFYYYGGYCYFYASSKPCVPPDRYYGIKQTLVNSLYWRLISYGWDEPRAVNADTWARKGHRDQLVRYHGSYWWRSESGRLNKYRRGVWIKYRLYVYQHKFTQKYRGTIHLPNYINYYYSRYWKVYVKYTGSVSKLNLTATRIQILDMHNHPVTFLHRGNRYKIRLTYKNTGTNNFYTYTDRFYENGSFLGDVSLNYRRNGILRPGQSKTVYLPFTENRTGRRTFKAIVNVGSYRNESNPNDNDISIGLLVENRPPVVDFTARPNPTNRLTTVQFTSHASDPDHDPITYNWSYQKSGTSRWIRFSRSVNPRLRFSQVGSYRVRLTVTDRYGKQATAIHWITVRDLAPNARFHFSPTTVYEGDSLKIINDSTDPEKDSLRANWTITSPNGRVTQQHSWNAQMNHLKAGTYRIHLQVTDTYGLRAGMTKTFTVKTLAIHGFVNHTADWEKIHQSAGDLPDQFYSGETFLLSAQVTNQPIRAVTVRFIGGQINGNHLDLSRNLSANPFPSYKGKLYDPRFSDPQQLLSTGTDYFQFKAVWKNGAVKTCIVPVHIIGDVYQVFFYHRTS